jgi:hypothetical protein
MFRSAPHPRIPLTPNQRFWREAPAVSAEHMTLQELQKQALQLPIGDRWQLVQTLLESLKRETRPKLKQRNLSRLRGIAKSSTVTENPDAKESYVSYLTEKYQ